VGHWTQPGGGITPVIVSAMQVAKKIIGCTRQPSFASTGLGLNQAASQFGYQSWAPAETA